MILFSVSTGVKPITIKKPKNMYLKDYLTVTSSNAKADSNFTVVWSGFVRAAWEEILCFWMGQKTMTKMQISIANRRKQQCLILVFG